MMRRDRVCAEQLTQMLGHALGHSARIHKDQGRAMRLNQLRQSMVNFLPNFVRHHRFKSRFREFNRQIQCAPVADVDDLAIGIAGLVHGMSADQKTRNLLDRFLRRRQTESLERMFC